MVKLFCVSGAIGAGKSEAVRHLKSIELPENFKIVIADEPVAEWLDDKGFNWLSSFYHDKARWAFSFQMKVMISITKSLRQQLKAAVELEKTGVSVILVAERTVLDSQVFLRKLINDGFISNAEQQIYNEFLAELDPPKPDILMYINATPETCHARIIHRKREGENKIELSYCEEIGGLYETALSKGELGSGDVVVLHNENQSLEEFQLSVVNAFHTFAVKPLMK